ncbi:hypothetical protein [Sphingomonas sp.]|jgi:hypothetical protein|uniref:hypothetical protein n=1 Tax=Sphingomonas sp. TaxID=28214 RepID=UPI00260FEF17|nr:hypothetical protein [Sphingomonas sp.]MDF2496091.1 hypothetical protein [Sphingomonas sp.]
MQQDGQPSPPSDPPRRRRPVPERDGPDRTGPHLASNVDARWSGPQASDQDDSEIPDVVADAVRMGYHVMEENLRHGRRAADRFRGQDYHLHDASKDALVMGRRVLDLARELGTTWFDLIGAVLDDPGIRAALGPQRAPDRPNPANSPVGNGSFPVQIVGHPRATGEAFLSTLVGLSGPIRITPLRIASASADAPAITGVRLGADPPTGAPTLLAAVPPDQPAGVYAGTIHESPTGRLLGSVSITVPPA